METKQVDAGSVKKGDTILINEEPCRVSNTEKSKPGKHGSAKIRIEAIGLFDSKKRSIVLPGHEKLNSPIILKKTAQVLSISGDTVNLMDNETYETFDLPIPEELKGQIIEGGSVLYWQIMANKVIKQVK